MQVLNNRYRPYETNLPKFFIVTLQPNQPKNDWGLLPMDITSENEKPAQK